MSQESVARFLELVASDKSLEAAMNAATEQQANIAATAVGLGKGHGLEFTSDEFASVIESFYREHPGELDDAELNGVSGGFNPQPEPPGMWDMTSNTPWFSQPWSMNTRRGP
ncbi:MAG: hypothetical protein DRJ61_12020 [Acidobacteria bacterium]|nr:MAG: hypothetical protein DRJ65_14200 [Acidobacteriota bacterium]RLE30929.1 MAG: hypothetical protein DRJ61_12020 [Acidobacteriota bacterium]